MDRIWGRSLVVLGLLAALSSCVPPQVAPDDAGGTGEPENTPVVAGETVAAADIYDPGLSDNRALFVAAPATMDFRESLTELVLVLRHFDPDEMTYEVWSEAAWVAGAQPTGKIVGGWVWVYVQVDRNKLVAGENTAKLHARVGDYPSVDINIRAYSANGGGQAGGVDVPDVTNPTTPGAGLYLSTNNLNFGLASTELALIVASRDQTPMNYTLAADAAWIGLSSAGGPNAGAYDQIAVTVNRDQLAPGAYSGIITVATDLGDSAQVAVSALVPEPDAVAPPEMVLDTLVLEYGVAETKRSLQISNGGSGGFTYSITPRDAWTTATPASGAVSTNVETVVLGIDRTNLPAGQNLGRIEVRADTGMVRDVFLVVTQLPPPDPNEPVVTPGDEDDPAQIAAWLAELPPLPKPHYAYPVFGNLVHPTVDPRLREFVRITHSLSMFAEATDSPSALTLLRAELNLLKSINATNPAIPARMGVFYTPWEHVFPDEAPPTYVGPEHAQEIALFRTRLTKFRTLLTQVNVELGTNIGVGIIALDSERFFRKAPGEPGAEEWNAAMDVKHNAIYDICKEIFPGVYVEWHLRGHVVECLEGTGWCESRYLTTNERGDGYAASLYRLPELSSMRESFRRTYANAVEDGEQYVLATVALACGVQRNLDGFEFTFDWDYDLIYSWQMGAELNWPSFAGNPERYAPYNASPQVLFYPEPFSTRVPHWGKHFVAYVRGAALIRELDDLPPGND